MAVHFTAFFLAVLAASTAAQSGVYCAIRLGRDKRWILKGETRRGRRLNNGFFSPLLWLLRALSFSAVPMYR